MADHPAKPPATAAPAAANGSSHPPGPTKQNLYNPNRLPYRAPSNRRHRRQSCRFSCCCCCFWSILLLLAAVLLAAIAGAALYVLYRPHRPQFSLTNLRIPKLNLTTSPDSPPHLISTLNLTLLAKNPNTHLVFSYDAFKVTAFSDGGVPLGNGSLPAFFSDQNNQTSLRTVLSGGQDLDTDQLTSFRSSLRKKKGFPLVIQMDTMVKLKMEWLKSKKVGIRVVCDGIKGSVPVEKTPSVASVTDSECKVDLRIKIWKFSF